MIVLGVPTLNRHDLCSNLLSSAANGTVVPDLAVVVDNGSGRIDLSGVAGRMPVEIIRPERNLGVGPSWNLLAKKFIADDSDRLLVVGDDVTLHADVVEKLLGVMSDGSVDFAFPDPARSTMHQMFSCFMAKLSLFEKVGFFDERFYPAYFEDNDFHYRMRLAGAVEAVASCGYDHVNSATIKKYTPKQKEAHHKQFRACKNYYVEKWGGLPHVETYKVPFNADGAAPKT